MKLRTYDAHVVAALVLVSLLLSSVAGANGLTDFPGAIPRTATRNAALDLVLDGRQEPLQPDEADALRARGQDLSLLNPADSSQWSNLTRPQSSPRLAVNVTGESFTFQSSFADQSLGRYRVLVTRPDANGAIQTYTLIFSKTSHNLLHRQALLRKLGYQVPDIKRLRSFKIQFPDTLLRKEFASSLYEQTFSNNEKGPRWLVSGDSDGSTELVLQDAVIVHSGDPIYNLALGSISAQMIGGRRVMNALLIPYNIVDVPESVNLFSWNSVRITNDMFVLDYEHSAAFFPSYDDARWMVRRLARLTRADFQEIALSADLPREIAAVLTEQFISRRNDQVAAFKIEAPAIPVNTRVSLPPTLVEGKVVHQATWPGYGRFFTNGNPDSPLSGKEIAAFAKSRGFSALIDNAIVQFNTKIVPHTDIQEKLIARQMQLAQEKFINYLKTGRVEKTPFGLHPIPTFGGNLIVSRDIVTGSYMGTDNLVQLADSFGFMVEAGVFFGVEGLPPKLGMAPQAKLSFVRTYTHLKPVRSIRTALKEDFKNVAVPLLKRDFAASLDAIPVLESKKLKEREVQDEINKAVMDFKSKFGVGESILITDSFNKNLGVSAGYGIVENIALQASIAAGDVNVKRLHIFRKDENTIQVYRDPAEYNLIQLSAGLKAFIPIFNVRFARKAGEADTYFFDVNINPDQNENPDVINNIKALRHLLRSNSTEALEPIKKPFYLNHKFQEKSSDGHILMWRWLNAKTTDRIRAVHPEGGTKDFLYWSESKVSGKNYEAVAVDVIGAILDEVTGTDDLVVPAPGAGVPGSGVYGSSVSRRAAFEAELNLSPARDAIAESYADVRYEWKGWEISKQNLLKIIAEIEEKFGFRFIQPTELQQTSKVQLYSVVLKMSLYKDGLQTLIDLPRGKLAELLTKENKYRRLLPLAHCRTCPDPSVQRKSERYIWQYNNAQKEYQESLQKNDVNRAGKWAMKLVSIAEAALSPRGFIELVGGEKNIFVQSAVSGFRVDDEADNATIIGAHIGQIGSPKPAGPIRFVQEKLGMTESEFFIYWLLNRI